MTKAQKKTKQVNNSEQPESLVYTGPTTLHPLPLQQGQVFLTIPALVKDAMKHNKQLQGYFVPLSRAGATTPENLKEGA